jgi:hypothetical protein
MGTSVGISRTTRGSRGGGLFRRTYEALYGSREQQARRVVNFHLLALDDKALESLGYDRRALEANGISHSPL